MKLSETELQELAKQLRCPTGDSGLKVGEMMNFTNSNSISKAIQSLKLKDGDTILEIGPGNGAHVASIINAVSTIDYQGIDISETMIGEAEKTNSHFDNVSFHLADGKHINFDNESFNSIFTVNTIYFWEEPQEFANEIARVLKKDGLASIGFIPESTMKKIPFAKYGFTLYDIASVIQLLETAGLKNIKTITDTEFVNSNSSEKIEREFIIITAAK